MENYKSDCHGHFSVRVEIDERLEDNRLKKVSTLT